MVQLRKLVNISLLIPMVVLVGCSNENTIEAIADSEIVAEIKEEAQTTIDLSDNKDFCDLEPNDVTSAKTPSELTEEELYNMSSYEIRCFLAKNYGNSFREHYSIKEDTILTDADYLGNIKAFICYETFGTFNCKDENGVEHSLLDTEEGKAIMEQMLNEQIPDGHIHLDNEPEISETDEEFILKLFEETKDNYCSSKEDEEAYLNMLYNLSEDELNQLKEKYQ